MPYVMQGRPFKGTEGFDDLGYTGDVSTELGYDDLGFSFGRIFTNIGTAVKKAVGDVTAESKRAAKNPLVQTAASFALPAIGGLSLVTRGLTVANALKNSRAGKAVETIQNVRRKLDTGADATDTITAGIEQLAPGSGIASAAARVRNARQDPNSAAVYGRSAGTAVAQRAAAAAKKAEADRLALEKKNADLASRRAAKVAEGARIQAENQRKADEAKAAAEKAAADQAARRAAKVEEGKKIRAKREADRQAAEAKRLELEAQRAAEAGQAAEAARLRDQAAAAADAGRAAAAVASQPSIYSAPVQSGPVPPDNYAAQAGGTAPAGGLSTIPTPYLLGGAALLIGGLYAATHHPGR